MTAARGSRSRDAASSTRRAGLRRGRRGLHARPGGVRDAARLRRPAVPARGAPRAARRARPSASASSLPRREAARARRARARARGPPEAVLRLYWTPGPPGGGLARSRSSAPIPDWIEEPASAASGSPRSAAAPLGAVAAPGDEVDELRGQHRRRGRGEGARRRRRAVRRPRRHGARGPGDEHLVARGRPALDPAARARDPGGRDPRRPARARRGRGDRRGGRLPAGRLLAADEVFTSSSVREVMPVVVVDGRPFSTGARRGRPSGRAAASGAGLTTTATTSPAPNAHARCRRRDARSRPDRRARRSGPRTASTRRPR